MINAEIAESQRAELNQITSDIIAAAIRVHIHLGPGLLEKAYEICLAHELTLLGLDVKTQVYLPIEYKGLRVKLAYRMDG